MRTHALANIRSTSLHGSSAARTSRGAHPLPSLAAAALTAVETLIWTLRTVPGRPYLSDHQQLAASLRRGDLVGAIDARNHIPWVVECAQGEIGGMVLYEHRHPRVRKASEATRLAFSRLKVWLKYGVVAKH